MKKNYNLLLLTLLIFLISGTLHAEVPDKPNIVFIFADDMGYGDVSVNNPFARTLTPAIDRLAEEGLRFTDAHSAGSVCTPSRYGLLTGRYFFRVLKKPGYAGYLSPYIEPERETVADLLKKNGYATACIGKWHLGLNWERKDVSEPLIPPQRDSEYTNTDFSSPVTGGPNDLGFDYSFILPGSLDMPPYVFVKNHKVVDPDVILTADVYPNQLENTEFAWDRKYTGEDDIYWERGVWWRNGEMSESFKMEDCLDVFKEESLSFIERESKKGNPFFLYLPLAGPHTPWLPGPEFKGTTGLGTYGDFIAHIDDVVYQITSKLEELNLDKNTMIIFSSDNGAAWEEQDVLQYAHDSSWGRRGMKGDAWDGGHHIPLIIKWPGKIKEGQVYDKTVGLIDFYSTLADLTGTKLSDNMAEDSFSFLRVLNGDMENPARDHLIYLSSSGRLAIKKGDWKYVEGLGSGGFSAPSKLSPVKNGPTGQLYNMKDDPLESNNLFLYKPDIVNDLTSLLEELVDRGYSRNVR